MEINDTGEAEWYETYYANSRYELLQDLLSDEGVPSQDRGISSEALKVLFYCFDEEKDNRRHGPILWSLMTKEGSSNKQGVLGPHMKVYLQYYYHYSILSSGHSMTSLKRRLDQRALNFMMCAAAFPRERVLEEFGGERVYEVEEVEGVVLDDLVIERNLFLDFFWPGVVEKVSFVGVWAVIDNLWDFWNCTSPVKILGFDTIAISRELLTKCNKEGAFLFRFSSQGGLDVDTYQKGAHRVYHWPAESVATLRRFLSRLYDDPSLLFLVGISSQNPFDLTPHLISKEEAFPIPNGDQFYERDANVEKILFLSETIKEQELTIQNLQKTINIQYTNLKRIQNKLQEGEQVRNFMESLEYKDKKYDDLTVKLLRGQEEAALLRNVEINRLQALVKDQADHIKSNGGKINTLSKKVESHEKTMNESEKKMQTMGEEVKSKNETIQNLKLKESEGNSDGKKKDLKIITLEKELKSMTENLKQKAEECKIVSLQLSEQKKRNQELSEKIQELELKNQKLEEKSNSLENEVLWNNM